jgi:hypothetical protein
MGRDQRGALTCENDESRWSGERAGRVRRAVLYPLSYGGPHVA